MIDAKHSIRTSAAIIVGGAEEQIMKHVFIVGSKGIPAAYGGFETFVEKLTENKASTDITYHVACAVDTMPIKSEYEHNGAHCFCIEWRPLGAARAITYDLDALNWCLKYIERNAIEKPIIYVLACRIGPFVRGYAKRIHKLGGTLLVNPDGHEWKRAKWSAPVRKYWKISEQLMVKHADLLVCDSLNIEKYISSEYGKYSPKTTYIAYGADVCPSALADDDPSFVGWLSERGLSKGGYYMCCGRFVPENSFEIMIREFMRSASSRDFAIITTKDDKFLAELDERLGWSKDKRIKFVGTVYDSELLKKIRENAYGNFHGHTVGGTNPSLLEALGATDLNLLIDIGFNREVAEDAALYWTDEKGCLAALIDEADAMDSQRRAAYGLKAKERIKTAYSWEFIGAEYLRLWNMAD